MDRRIRLYIGVNCDRWNYHPVHPGPFACVSPVYGRSERTKKENRVSIPADTLVRQDSGAFCDGPRDRLTFAAALDRQNRHAAKYGYERDSIASYDLLIDEKWIGGRRRKKRWSASEAGAAVHETIQATKFLNQHRNGLPLVLSAQGVEAAQYLDCVKRIMSFMQNDDVLGLGGWCISGLMPTRIRPTFNATMLLVVPFAANEGVRDIHIWGVSDPTFLGPLLWLCDQHGLTLSTDSSGPQVRPTRGEWGYRGWREPYINHPVMIRGAHRIMHGWLTRIHLACLRYSEFYHHPELPDKKQEYLLKL